MEPSNKISTSKPAVTITANTLSPPNPKKSELYLQQRGKVPEYSELFTALMKLSDKEMRSKIINVINHKTVEYRSMETQTDPVHIREFKREENDQQIYIIKELVPDSTSLNTNPKEPEESIASKKRKRKRKISLPHANKESRVLKQVAKTNKPIPLNSHSLNKSYPFQSQSISNPSKRQREDSLNFDSSTTDSLINNVFEEFSFNEDYAMKNLVKDVILSTIEVDGLLPIHETIVKNQDKSLKMQIYIWKDFKKIDLNELLTNDDQDLLQFAIVNSTTSSIINILLEAGLNPDCLDGESNTVLHLAILNDIEVSALDHLMQHIDLKLLTILNDDGYNPLHLAVRKDRFLLAERLINILDNRLVGKICYEFKIDIYETDANITKTKFKDYYEKVCFLMDAENENTYLQNHDLKQKLLQTGDRRSGNTALYFAIENKFDHLIYFLLAHLSDPRTENLCGLDCKTFFSEYGKSLNLTLNIDNAMEKVIKILS